MEIKLHPQAQAVLDHLAAKLDQDGNKKLDAADLVIAQQKAAAKADQFVAERTPLKALLIMLVSGFALGVIARHFIGS